MDWCKEIDDLSLLSDHVALALCAEDRSLPVVDWFNSEFTRSGKIISPHVYYDRSIRSAVEEFDTDRRGLYTHACKGSLLHQGGGSDFGPCKEPSFVDCSARTSEASTSDQPDCELQHSLHWMDENFLNSLQEEDPRNMGIPLESLNLPDSVYRTVSSEDLLTVTDMIIDQMHHVATADASTSTGKFPVITNDIPETWGREEDSQLSCFIQEEPKGSEGSATDSDGTVMLPPQLTVCNESRVVGDLDEQKCLEATVLQDLEGIIMQLSDGMRACFRDALYCLAMNSKEQHRLYQNRCSNFINGASLAEMNDENSSMRGTGRPESKTNVIDRTIANLMFNKPCYDSPSDPCRGSLHNSMNSLAPCGSFYSLQQPVDCCSYQGPTLSQS